MELTIYPFTTQRSSSQTVSEAREERTMRVSRCNIHWAPAHDQTNGEQELGELTYSISRVKEGSPSCVDQHVRHG